MKRKKKFDCLQMKWDIQRKLQQESPDATEGQRRRTQMERVENNPLLKPFLEQISPPHRQPSQT